MRGGDPSRAVLRRLIASSRVVERLVGMKSPFSKAPAQPSARSSRSAVQFPQVTPGRLAIMHGSGFEGEGGKALQDLAGVFKEVFGSC